VNAGQTGPAIKIGIKTQDRSNSAPLHHRNMEGVARRYSPAPDDFRGPQNVHFPYGEDLVYDIQSQLEHWSNRLSLGDGCVPVENFLEYFRTCPKALPRSDQPFQQDLGIRFVWVGPSGDVHEAISVDERQSRYLRSVSSNICSISAPVKAYVAAMRIAFSLVSGA
jgi:hypothetical protein